MTHVILLEYLRRAVGLPSNANVSDFTISGKDVVISYTLTEKVSVTEPQDKIKIINNALKLNKEISFVYDGEEREIIPISWGKQESITGYDINKEDYRTFFLSKMNKVTGPTIEEES